MISSLCLALALVGQCPGGRCPARVQYYSTAPAPVYATAQSPFVYRSAPAPAPAVPSAPGPVLYPTTPLPPDCRYIWNGYMWAVYRIPR